MDTLVLGIERLLMGAHVGLEIGSAGGADWLVSELQALYSAHRSRCGDVTVRVLGPARIEILGSGGIPRTLQVDADGKWWELANSAAGGQAVHLPGPLAAILADVC